MSLATPNEPSAETRAEWLAEFEAAARRPLATRLRYSFIHTYKPVLDDEPYRSFETMAEYRAWCAENLPAGPPVRSVFRLIGSPYAVSRQLIT